MRRKTSVSVRTAVVLPVPPFCDRTEIVAAHPRVTIGGWPAGRRGPVEPLVSPAETARPGMGLAHARDDWNVDEIQAMAPDHDLVGIGQRAPLDPLAVDEHTVEAAVIQHPQAVRLSHDQGVPAGHRGVVEPDVRREASPDPGPFTLQRVGNDVVSGAVGDVLPRLVQPDPQLSPARRDRPPREGSRRAAFCAVVNSEAPDEARCPRSWDTSAARRRRRATVGSRTRCIGTCRCQRHSPTSKLSCRLLATGCAAAPGQ